MGKYWPLCLQILFHWSHLFSSRNCNYIFIILLQDIPQLRDAVFIYFLSFIFLLNIYIFIYKYIYIFYVFELVNLFFFFFFLHMLVTFNPLWFILCLKCFSFHICGWFGSYLYFPHLSLTSSVFPLAFWINGKQLYNCFHVCVY